MSSLWRTAIQRLLRRDTPRPAHAGEEQWVTGQQALLATEYLACDAVWHPESQLLEALRVNAFGRSVSIEACDGHPRTVGAMVGASMTGLRAAAFLPGGGLDRVRDELANAAARRVPFVLHATAQSLPRGGAGAAGGHDGYHAVAGTGAMLAFARDAQHAVDLTLVARRAAELALCPAVVAVDGPETAWAVRDARMPSAALVDGYLGRPESRIDSPTPAQTILFGGRRRRLPRWFDPDCPVAHGMVQEGADAAAAIAGRHPFFAEHVQAIVRLAGAELTGMTGREVPMISRHGLDKARFAIVAQGAAVELAEAVVDHLRQSEGLRIGVVGVHWLRPFPTEELREALGGLTAVAVMERGDDPMLDEPPLLREVLAALGSEDGLLLPVTYGIGGQPVTAAQIAAMCRVLARGTSAPAALRLGIRPTGGRSAYPKRQVLLEQVARSYPHLSEQLIDPDEILDLRPEGARTVTWLGTNDDTPDDVLDRLADTVSAIGPHVRSRVARGDDGVRRVQVTASSKPFADPGDAVPADVMIVSTCALPAEVNPFALATRGAAVVLRSGLPHDELWAQLPVPWRSSARSAELALHVVDGGAEELLAACSSLLTGEGEAPTRLDWAQLGQEQSPEDDPELPLAVRRFARGEAYGSVATFWGELGQPLVDGEIVTPAPDPALAVGVVPPSTAGVFDVTAGRTSIPHLDPSACTGCGRCWVACPDSAIGAVAISTEALLDAAADSATPPGVQREAVAAKLARAHKQLAARLDGQLAKSDDRVLDASHLRDAYSWLVDKMGVSEGERPAMDVAFEATLAHATAAPLAVTESLFRGAHAAEKGTGAHLLLAFSAQACQGCGGCADVCPEDAISMVPQTEEGVAAMREAWRSWEKLPDTAGRTIARASELEDVGPLASVLMSRHCLSSLAGGDGAEPGSGGRLAVRQVVAVVESEMQKRLATQLAAMETLSVRLRQAIRDRLADAVSVQDLASLDEALGSVPNRPANVAMVLSKLEELGERPSVNTKTTRRLVRVTRDVERLRERLASGRHGQGRARFGIVVAGEAVIRWAARYPRNPFGVPVAVDATGSGVELAGGVVRGQLMRHVSDMRLLRLAELLLAAPSDLPAKERELVGLTHRDLTDAELALCPPTLLLTSLEALAGDGLTALAHNLSSDLPLRAVVLDDRDLRLEEPDPTLLALSQRRAYVLSSSIAHPAHLFDGVAGALRMRGPALLRLHAPSPRRHGFPADKTVARAREAVDARVAPLLRYDPQAAGVFGSRLSLAGNPAPADPWALDPDGAPWTPRRWAAGEARHASADLESREADLAQTWLVLQELAGIVTPFTADVRAQVAAELAAEHQAELAALRADYEGRVAEATTQQSADQAQRLRDRLLTLAGYSTAGRDGGRGSIQ